MNQISERLRQWLEKVVLLLKKGRKWAAANKKISIPAAVIIVAALLAVVSMLGRSRDADTAQDGTGAADSDLSAISVPEIPLEENAVAAVNILMEKYYTALADGDTETLTSLKNYISDTEKLRIEKKSKYIEKYQNLTCYPKTGVEADSYLVYAYNEAKFYDIETAAPGLNTFVVYKNDSGEYYIYEGDLDDNTFNYFQELSAQDDVTNLCNTIQAKYNEAIADDEQLAEFMEEFPQLIKDEVSMALAELEQENAEETSDSEAVEAEEEETEEDTQEAKARVTEVETTDTVNVRSSDSETADKVGKAEKGMRLPLIEKKENGWSKVEFEGSEAYIKSEYLADVVNVVEEDTDGSASESTDTQETAAAEQTQTSNTGTVGKDGKVTATTTVNVRATANENGERLGVIYQGEKLELVMQQADGWCKVKYNGKTGYVKTEYVE